MKTYARIEAGTVAELLRTEANPADLFHHALRWVEVSETSVAVGWLVGPAGLVPPPPPRPATAAMPTLDDLHARVLALEAMLAGRR